MKSKVDSVRIADVEERYAPAERLLEVSVLDGVLFLDILRYDPKAKFKGLNTYERIDGMAISIEDLLNSIRAFGVKI